MKFFLVDLPPPRSTLFPYTTLFRSGGRERRDGVGQLVPARAVHDQVRSEEHTSELQSHHDLVCRLLLEKKKPGALLNDVTQHFYQVCHGLIGHAALISDAESGERVA